MKKNKLILLDSVLEKIQSDKLDKLFVKKLWMKNDQIFYRDTINVNENIILESVEAKYYEFSLKVKNHIKHLGSVTNYKQPEAIKQLTYFFKQIFPEAENIGKTPEYISYNLMEKLSMCNSDLCVKKDEYNYMTFATCHHIYNKVPSVPGKYILYGHCYRNEDYYNIYRLFRFTMLELVVFDSYKNIEDIKLKLMYILFLIGQALGDEKMRMVVAFDSFLTDNPKLLLYQFIEKTKFELQFLSSKTNEYVSVASINLHKNHMTDKFHIGRDSSLQSMCMGIGLERILNI